MSSTVPMLPSAEAALRASPHRFARFIGEPLSEAENSGCHIPNSSRASVRASFAPNTSRVAYGEPSGSAFAILLLNGHTSWDVWPYNHFAIPLGTGSRTLGGARS